VSFVVDWGAASELEDEHEWFVVYESHGQRNVAVARTKTGYLVRVFGVSDYDVGPSTVTFHPATGVSPAATEDAYKLAVLPALHQLNGRPALHASAVAGERGAIAFVGPSGRGKSTLAALLSSGGHYRLMADDYLPLHLDEAGQVWATPTSTAVRLRGPAAEQLNETKVFHQGKFVAARPVAHHPQPLVRLYVITVGVETRVISMKGRDAVAVVAEHLQRLDPHDPELLKIEFEFIDALVKRVRVAELSYPSRYETAEIEAVIAHDLQSNGLQLSGDDHQLGRQQ
jgi:hypothetical protein